MSSFKKHVGRIVNTDRRCVVVFMKIPGNEDNALIVDTDALPDRFHDALLTVVDSTEGQQNPDLHLILARRILPDLGVDILTALHTYGFLRPVPIDNIVMYPAPNKPCPLRTIVDFMNGEEVSQETQTSLENRHLENQKSETQQAQIDIALNILRQAEDLENDAKAKRERAYHMAPELRPTLEPATPSPQVTEASAYVTPEPAPSGYFDPTITPLDNSPYGFAEALALRELTENASTKRSQAKEPDQATQVVLESAGVPDASEGNLDVVLDIDPTLPLDVQEALRAAHGQFVENAYDYEVEGNQVDTSDDAIAAFLDRAAYREDKADKEKWEAMQPKNPVGRPRKDGTPAGTKPEAAPKRRGRPPKAKSNAKAKAKTKASVK